MIILHGLKVANNQNKSKARQALPSSTHKCKDSFGLVNGTHPLVIESYLRHYGYPQGSLNNTAKTIVSITNSARVTLQIP